jgi:hypothetical protein
MRLRARTHVRRSPSSASLGLSELSTNQSARDEPNNNFGKGDLGLSLAAPAKHPAQHNKTLRAVLTNSRLATAAVLGTFFQDGPTASTCSDCALYTDSPEGQKGRTERAGAGSG